MKKVLFLLIIFSAQNILLAQYRGYKDYTVYAGYPGYNLPEEDEKAEKYKESRLFNQPINSTQSVKNFISWEARRNGVPVELALAVAQAESGFGWWKTSWTGAAGVFQFTRSTWRETNLRMNRPQYTGLQHRYNPRLSIEAAIYLLKHREYHHWYPYTGHKWGHIYRKYFKPYGGKNV